MKLEFADGLDMELRQTGDENCIKIWLEPMEKGVSISKCGKLSWSKFEN